MGKPTGFLEHERRPIPNRVPTERVKDWNEIHEPFEEETFEKNLYSVITMCLENASSVGNEAMGSLANDDGLFDESLHRGQITHLRSAPHEPATHLVDGVFNRPRMGEVWL